MISAATGYRNAADTPPTRRRHAADTPRHDGAT